jgi:hypothetical protein
MKPSYLFEDWLQAFREVEIESELLLLGMDFDDHENIAVASDCRRLVPHERQVRPAVDGSRARYHTTRRFYR